MSYTVPENIAEVRAKAWETRRSKYGQRGHAGSYMRGPYAKKMLDLIITLHAEEVLSEGQVAQATGLDRPIIRKLVQAL